MEWLKSAEVYDCVVRAGSFSEAGRRLNCSPATVSRHINDLEEHLNVKLMNRTSRNLSLTEAGQLYHGRLQEILNHIREARVEVAELDRAPAGLLRVHSRNVIGHQFIVPALHRFHAKFPEIRVDLELSNHAVDLVAKGFDIDIRMGKLQDSSLVARKLLPSQRILCASPAYLARHPAPQIPEDLERHSCLNYRINETAPLWRLRPASGGPEVSIRASGVFTSNSGLALLQATLDGAGISIMNYWSVAEHLSSGRLVQVLPHHDVTFSEFENGIYAVFQKNRGVPSKIRHFLDFLVNELKNNGAFRRSGPT